MCLGNRDSGLSQRTYDVLFILWHLVKNATYTNQVESTYIFFVYFAFISFRAQEAIAIAWCLLLANKHPSIHRYESGMHGVNIGVEICCDIIRRCTTLNTHASYVRTLFPKLSLQLAPENMKQWRTDQVCFKFSEISRKVKEKIVLNMFLGHTNTRRKQEQPPRQHKRNEG